MATIVKIKGTKGTRYRAQVRRKGHPAQSETFARKKDAEIWARDLEQKIDAGKLLYSPEAKKRILADLIDRYVEELLPYKKNAENQMKQLLVWKGLLGTEILIALNSDTLLKARGQIAQRKVSNGDRISTATINRYTAALSHVLEVGVKQYHWLDTNPMRQVVKLKENQGRDRTLSHPEIQILLAECRKSQNPNLELVTLMALTTAMRKGEIMSLTWDKVDLDTGLAIIEEPKNGQRRSATLMPDVIERLKALKRKTNYPKGHLFPGKRPGKPIDIKKAWQKAVRESGIEDFRFHDLRHTAATIIAMNGGSVPQIATILGHKSHQMASRYAHLTEVHTRPLLEKSMRGIFDGAEVEED